METVRKQIQSLEPNLPLTNVQTMGQQLDQALFAPRMGAALLGLFFARWLWRLPVSAFME